MPGTGTKRHAKSRARSVREAAAWVILSGVAVALVACGERDANRDEVSAGPSSASAIEVVESQIEAFNAHDATALAELVSDDFVWLSVQGDTIDVAVQGRTALRESMKRYFESVPSVRSTLESAVATGPFVAVRERVRWKEDEGRTRSQASLAVYQIEEGRIRRVWYFPAVKR